MYNILTVDDEYEIRNGFAIPKNSIIELGNRNIVIASNVEMTYNQHKLIALTEYRSFSEWEL